MGKKEKIGIIIVMILSVFIIISLGIGAKFYLKTDNVSKGKDETKNEIINSTIIEVAKEEILNEVKKEINLLTSKKIDYIIITGGTSNIPGFEHIAKDVFGDNANIGNVKLLGIRDNSYSACVGNLVYFVNKLKLKNQNYP